MARLLARAATEGRRTLDSPRLGIGSLTDDEVASRMLPPRSKDGSTARTIRMTLSTRSSKDCRHASSLKPRIGPGAGPPRRARKPGETAWRRAPPRLPAPGRPRSRGRGSPPTPSPLSRSDRDPFGSLSFLHPGEDAFQRRFGAPAPRRPGRADSRVRQGAPAAQHFLADRDANPFLEFESHDGAVG